MVSFAEEPKLSQPDDDDDEENLEASYDLGPVDVVACKAYSIMLGSFGFGRSKEGPADPQNAPDDDANESGYGDANASGSFYSTDSSNYTDASTDDLSLEGSSVDATESFHTTGTAGSTDCSTDVNNSAVSTDGLKAPPGEETSADANRTLDTTGTSGCDGFSFDLDRYEAIKEADAKASLQEALLLLRQAAAAVKIQRVWLRKRLYRQTKAREAAVIVQRSWLRFASRRRVQRILSLRRRTRVAIHVQCLYRQRKARLLLEHLKRRAVISAAATQDLSNAKMFIERLKNTSHQSQLAARERQQLQALIRIQCHARGYLTRRVTDKLLAEWREFNKAAIVIQSVFRMASAHANAVKLTEHTKATKEDAPPQEDLDVGPYEDHGIEGFSTALTCACVDMQPMELMQCWDETITDLSEVQDEVQLSEEKKDGKNLSRPTEKEQEAKETIKATVEALAVIKIQRAWLRFANRESFQRTLLPRVLLQTKRIRAAISIQGLYRIVQSKRAADSRRLVITRCRMISASNIICAAVRQRRAKMLLSHLKMQRKRKNAATSIQGLYRIIRSKRIAEGRRLVVARCRMISASTIICSAVRQRKAKMLLKHLKMQRQVAAQTQLKDKDVNATEEVSILAPDLVQVEDPTAAAFAATVAPTEAEMKASLQHIIDPKAERPGEGLEEAKESLAPSFAAAMATKEAEMKASVRDILDSRVAQSISDFTSNVTDSLAESAMQSIALMRSWEDTPADECTVTEEKRMSQMDSHIDPDRINDVSVNLVNGEDKAAELEGIIERVGGSPGQTLEDTNEPLAPNFVAVMGAKESEMKASIQEVGSYVAQSVHGFTAALTESLAESEQRAMNSMKLMQWEETTAENLGRKEGNQVPEEQKKKLEKDIHFSLLTKSLVESEMKLKELRDTAAAGTDRGTENEENIGSKGGDTTKVNNVKHLTSASDLIMMQALESLNSMEGTLAGVSDVVRRTEAEVSEKTIALPVADEDDTPGGNRDADACLSSQEQAKQSANLTSSSRRLAIQRRRALILKIRNSNRDKDNNTTKVSKTASAGLATQKWRRNILRESTNELATEKSDGQTD